MSKPTDLQKRVIDILIKEMGYWQSSNDIHSPSHASSIMHDMFINDDDYDMGEGEKAFAMDIIAEMMCDVWNAVAALSPSGR